MQAIMLAAGKGSRLGKYTKNNTKCMLNIHEIAPHVNIDKKCFEKIQFLLV